MRTGGGRGSGHSTAVFLELQGQVKRSSATVRIQKKKSVFSRLALSYSIVKDEIAFYENNPGGLVCQPVHSLLLLTSLDPTVERYFQAS